LVVAVARHLGHVDLGGADGVEFLAEVEVFLREDIARLEAVALVVVQAAEGIVVAELHVAVVDLLQRFHRHLVVGDHIGGAHDGAFHIFGQFLARANLHIFSDVVQSQAVDFLNVGPFLFAVDKLLGKLARHTVGVFLALAFNDVGIVAHAAFEAHHDFGVVGMK